MMLGLFPIWNMVEQADIQVSTHSKKMFGEEKLYYSILDSNLSSYCCIGSSGGNTISMSNIVK